MSPTCLAKACRNGHQQTSFEQSGKPGENRVERYAVWPIWLRLAIEVSQDYDYSYERCEADNEGEELEGPPSVEKSFPR